MQDLERAQIAELLRSIDGRLRKQNEPLKLEDMTSEEREKAKDLVISAHSLAEILQYDQQNLEPLRREEKQKREFERYAT